MKEETPVPSPLDQGPIFFLFQSHGKFVLVRNWHYLMVFNQQMTPGRNTWRIVLVLSPAMRGGARNRNRTVTRNAAQEIDYDYDYAHEHEQPELPVTICYFREF